MAAFVEGVREESERAGIPVNEIVSEETDEPEPLPATFFKAPNGRMERYRRKLDEGIQVLREIKDDTAAIEKGTAAIRDETS